MRITLPRSATSLFFHLFLATFYQHAIADVYLYAPRSLSNRILRNSMNRENDNRVVDFQNNAEEDYNAPGEDINPTENVAEGRKLPRLFEGDIVLTPDDTERLKELQDGGDIEQSSPNITKRNAMRNRKYLWVTKIIPYEVPNL